MVATVIVVRFAFGSGRVRGSTEYLRPWRRSVNGAVLIPPIPAIFVVFTREVNYSIHILGYIDDR